MATRRSLTMEQRGVLAKRHLNGASLLELEGYQGLSLAQLRAEFETQRMKDALVEAQTYIDAIVVRGRNRMISEFPGSVDRMTARGSDKEQPQIAFQADKLIIDHVLPKHDRLTVDKRETSIIDPPHPSRNQRLSDPSGQNHWVQHQHHKWCR